MDGFCAPISGKRFSKKRIKQTAAGIVVDNAAAAAADSSYDGIKTVDLDLSDSTCHLCICIVTWNMNGQVRYEELKRLVGNDRNCDLLVIGLQEVPRTRNVLQMFENALHSSHLLLEEAVMQSLHLYMFGSKKCSIYVKDIKVDKQGVGGCGGLIGRKKGAVAIKITYKGIPMIFISCHLSAHGHKVGERNSEFRHLSQSLFAKNWNPQVTVWLGDLNYRLQGIQTFPARNLIGNNLHRLLTCKDQLLQEANKGQVFNGYCEGNLSFKPTYKYNVGTSDYDTSYKVRVPAWTDRILYKVEDKDVINASLHLYESLDAIHGSDHKPVKAHLCLKFNNNSCLKTR
ncbi:type IV inositol polyphosphate 5-phosphatase 11 [Andrographis paniculata]|uniref:type IV inositol polyphosphate 5-phosphatase 11 n=1 Tax=Andrographis paniculata TaxID=175694 RepID=UPI0021E807B5|nr:type IV inositol polyphosphate 5-phosphatase 11 [Andrographis paniculata]